MSQWNVVNYRKPIIAGIMSLTALTASHAQKVFQLSAETGVTGEIDKEMVYSGGLHGIFSGEKNCTDMYCGMLVDADKQFTLESQLEHEYSWTDNISSWIRETFHLSKVENNLTSEFAPLKLNTSFGKFDAFAAPLYAIENDFKDKDTKQNLGLVLNTTYNIDSKNSVKVEAEYSTEPAKNLFKTKFGKLKDNISFVISYIKNFN